MKVSRKNGAQTAQPTPRLNNFLSSGFAPIETGNNDYAEQMRAEAIEKRQKNLTPAHNRTSSS